MINYTITATCENGHKQKVTVEGSLGREYAESLAGLLDGSSSMYVHDPRESPDSGIGKCGLCHRQIECAVD